MQIFENTVCFEHLVIFVQKSVKKGWEILHLLSATLHANQKEPGSSDR